MTSMRAMAVQGANRKPKTDPTPASAQIISRLCNQTRGIKNHRIPQVTEIREATGIGEERPSTTNTPQENRKMNKTFKAILNFEAGIRKRMSLSRTTAPKK